MLTNCGKNSEAKKKWEKRVLAKDTGTYGHICLIKVKQLISMGEQSASNKHKKILGSHMIKKFSCMVDIQLELQHKKLAHLFFRH